MITFIIYLINRDNKFYLYFLCYNKHRMGNYMKRIKLKKRKNKLRFKRKLVITSTLVLLLVLGIGYSALSVNLNINGDITVRKYYGDTLYKVLEDEAAIGTYASEYTEDHQDSMAGVGSEKIYYWYADNNTAGNSKANEILDKWNVIFAGYCWQMIRTTDTGGVKLLYNGVPNEGKCNNTGVAQTIGYSKFQRYSNSPGYVGYMYNTIYNAKEKDGVETRLLKNTSMTGSSNYYYGTGVVYSDGMYTLTGITQATWSSRYSSSSGLYTCKSTTATTCSTVYYIAGGYSYSMYGFEMTDGNLLNHYNTNITIGTGYTESGGTYTLTGTISTITKADWFSNYNTYSKKYTCGDDATSCTDLKYITWGSVDVYRSVSSLSNKYIYANDFTYNNGSYTLGSDRINVWEVNTNDKIALKYHHYTCFNQTEECSTLSYVYHIYTPQGFSYIEYIDLTNGKSVEDAKNEMLYNDNVNQIESEMKIYIDNWYASNMTAYTEKLEDTIFCSNRDQSNESTNGWNPNGGGGGSFPELRFNYSSLFCVNDTDKFSVLNNKAKLTYPVGLASEKEMELLNNRNLKKISAMYWLFTPGSFSSSTNGARVNYVDANGSQLGTYSVDDSMRVRPVVSLKPFTKIFSGTGSKDDPYIVDTN